MMPRGAGLISSLSLPCGPRSLLGLWLLAAVLPLGRRLALLRDLVGWTRGFGSDLGGGFRLTRSMGLLWWVSRGVSWCPFPEGVCWLEDVVTTTLDNPASDCLGDGPRPLFEAMSPDTERAATPPSIPLADAVEPGPLRAEASEHTDETDVRWTWFSEDGDRDCTAGPGSCGWEAVS